MSQMAHIPRNFVSVYGSHSRQLLTSERNKSNFVLHDLVQLQLQTLQSEDDDDFFVTRRFEFLKIK